MILIYTEAGSLPIRHNESHCDRGCQTRTATKIATKMMNFI